MTSSLSFLIFSVLVSYVNSSAYVEQNPCYNGGRQRHLRRPMHRHRHRRADVRFPSGNEVMESESEIAIDAELAGGLMHCICSYKYEGARCEKRIYTCGHGEKSRDASTHREYCRCHHDWTGNDCITPVCHNGLLDERDQRCLCEQGWTGTHCNIPVCGVHGLFVGGKCLCADGFERQFCDVPTATTLLHAATWSAAFSFPLMLVIIVIKMNRNEYRNFNKSLASMDSTKSLISLQK
ncbi:hypothetical protein L596_017306 [Steinernema carpocapsae]|uniref:EGF-like domain-containing protein n=1 Tax=Steinernema carpocapsae TaxID=34508 RepID=A0A4U5N1Y7_STECR|nr:hypothetical protein L596_017306 [Steinernema carpocapsae]